MAQQHGHLLSLPQELHSDIVTRLDSLKDVRSVAQSNRYFFCLFFDYMLDLWFTEKVNRRKAQETRGGTRRVSNTVHPPSTPETRCYIDFVAQAIRTDCWLIIDYLATRRKELNLMGSLPGNLCERIGYKADAGFLHLALAFDAPHVAVYLLKAGVDMSREMSDYPDLMPLCLTLSTSRTSTQEGLDASLRFACSYVLPRTVTYLLVRGANPNAYSPYGLNAIHWLLSVRLPGLTLSSRLGSKLRDRSWNSRILTILTTLLEYGSDIHSPTQTASKHECHPGCWKSVNCSHGGETALHLAAASRIPDVIPLLVENGADPQALNGDGYTPLYEALRQENKEAVDILLGLSTDENPVVHAPQRSTALHIACRFAYTRIVDQLLYAGVSADVVDSQGYTPLDEVLKHMKVERDNDVLHTLRRLLGGYGANPGISTSLPSARELAKSHPLQAVREMFGLALPTRPARLRMRKMRETPEPADRPVKAQADHPPPKIRAWKNPKSLVDTSVRPVTTKGTPERARGDDSQIIPNAPAAVPPIKSTPAREKESSSPLSLTAPPKPSAWIGGDISKILDLAPPPSRENKQFGKEVVQRPREAEEPFPALTEDRGVSVAGGDNNNNNSAAASFWSGFPRSPAGSHLHGELEQKKSKRGRARWKPFVP
ncbi:ankyrin repeat-containing domain protein [Ustulina deusta]|nr:ankyrin repeat-containing domain protein [Ustulina deusta]